MTIPGLRPPMADGLIPSSFFTSFPAFPVKPPNPLAPNLRIRLFLSQKITAHRSLICCHTFPKYTQLLVLPNFIFRCPFAACSGIIASLQAPATHQIRAEIIIPFNPRFLSTALPIPVPPLSSPPKEDRIFGVAPSVLRLNLYLRALFSDYRTGRPSRSFASRHYSSPNLVDGLADPHDMNAWLTDASNIPNHDNGTFNGTIDPSMAFLQPSQAPQDPAQFQRMFQNGVPRNVSPGFHNPNQVIPSKRPRPEDGITMSPRQAPGGLPVSRSQTPQVPYPGYQGPANGNPQFAHPNPYQHLQQPQQQRGPLNASQSPSLQEFDQHGVQKMQTSSPNPFSPAGPVTNQISTPQSDHGSRVNTPQNNTFIPAQAFTQGVAPQFAQQAAMTSGATPASMQAQLGNMPQGFSPQAMAAQQQRLYQMQLQNQARQMQVNNPAMVSRPTGAMNHMINPQMAALRQMQHNMSQPNISKANSPEIFLKTLQKFMMNRNMPLDLNPVVSGRPIHLMPLYGTVMKMGGSKKLSATNMWPAIAQALQFPLQQYPNAPAEIREIYAKNLAPYENAILISTHQQKQIDSMQQNALQRQSADANSTQFQQSPVKAAPEFDAPGSQQFTPSPQVTATMSNNMPAGATNGPANPQQPRQSKQQPQPQQFLPPHGQSSQRATGQRQAQVPASPADSSSQSQVAPLPGVSAKPVASTGKAAPGLESAPTKAIKHHIDQTFKATVLPDNHRHGPVVVDEIYQLGEEIARLKPNVPAFPELGVIDIHAITMSIKSGIHAEVRVALDTLMTLSSEAAVLSLDNCDDLVETLVDCAEEQLDLLAEHAAEVSDEMLLPSYEEVIRGCHVEMASLLDVPEFGSLGYELDRAADRVLCITAIIRNFSFAESNFGILGSAPVITMFSTIVRYLGTRNMLLRTNQNILDFMKDAVTYLSNISQTVHLPGKEEAFCLLHFFLSFAPLPTPVLRPDGVTFAQYTPTVHKYTPAAIDGLAKLLARDEPNRMYFKAIFQESQSSSRNELLTRAFGMAICPVPDQPRKPLSFPDARKVFLMQGLLAAEILTGLADGITARTWLQSTDGFAVHLLRLCCLLSTDRLVLAPNPRHPQSRGQQDPEYNAYVSIINRGLSILRKLAEKSKQEDSISGQHFPLCLLPKRESLLGALLTPNLDAGVVKQLIAYAGLGD